MGNTNDLIAYANGTFRPAVSSTPQEVKFTNSLLVPIQIILINADGSLSTTKVKLDPGEDSTVDSFVNAAWLVTMRTTGSLIDILLVPEAKGTPNVVIDKTHLPMPSIVGSPPSTMDVPTFLVGQGKDPKNDNKVITREVWWYLTPNTLSLPPGGSRSWTFSTSEGVEDSTTSLSQMSSELGTSISGGWGPISTELEQSLSRSSSTSQTVTLTSSSTQSESLSLSNTFGKGDMTVRAWQVRERYAIWKSNGSVEVLQIVNDTNDVQAVTTFSDGSTQVKMLDAAAT